MLRCAAGGECGLVQRAFLLLCPAPPSCFELDHVVKAATQLMTLSARALVSARQSTPDCATPSTQQYCSIGRLPARRIVSNGSSLFPLQPLSPHHTQCACHLMGRAGSCCACPQALSACLLVPVLLGVIRQVQQEHGPAAAAAVTVSSLLLLLAADTLSRRAQKQRAAAQAACVTAATLQQFSAGMHSHFSPCLLVSASGECCYDRNPSPAAHVCQAGFS